MRRLALLLLLLTPLVTHADGIAYSPLDDFEDVTPWLKGDPNTDMTQAEVGVRPEKQIVQQGKQSLAFMVRVDWTPKPGEKYPQGWPMTSRTFKDPHDWSQYDLVEFWLYVQTEATLPSQRVIGFGAFPQDKSYEDWDFPTGIIPNRWQKHVLPLHLERDLTRVGGIRFYVAEGWYQDKDRINFYIDDMRLGRYTQARFQSASVSPGFDGRGKSVAVNATIAGPLQGASIKGSLLSGKKTEATFQQPLTGKSVSFSAPCPRLSGGNYRAVLQLVSADGKQLDRREQYLRMPAPGKRTYLNLITFYSPAVMDAKAETLAVLNDSAYAGVALPAFSGYDAGPIPEYSAFADQMKLVRGTLKIDPWPWVFSNRLIGTPPDATGHSSRPQAEQEYFKAINILDLDDKAGARADFLKQFRTAVRMAKDWKSPGVVLDLEAYNNYKAYDVAYVATQRGETIDQVIGGCEQLGADLAKVCQEEYPPCIVWSLFSHLLNPRQVQGRSGVIYNTSAHIVLGFLEYCKQHKLPTKYLCGGEDSPGYYNKNVTALRTRMAQRYRALAPIMERYPDHYLLAGTISPYHDHTLLTSWIQNAAGADPELKIITDFRPMFRSLFEAYDWVWLYAASAARTEPYKPENNRLYSDALKAALDEAAGGAE